MNMFEEKIREYLSGLRELKGHSFPIGAVIVDKTNGQNNNKHEVIKRLKEEGLKAINTDINPDLILKKIFDLLSKGKSVALDIEKEIPIKVLHELQNIYLFNRIILNFPGESDKKILSLIPSNTFLLLIMDSVSYKNSLLGEIASSFCNLTPRIY